MEQGKDDDYIHYADNQFSLTKVAEESTDDDKEEEDEDLSSSSSSESESENEEEDEKEEQEEERDNTREEQEDDESSSESESEDEEDDETEEEERNKTLEEKKLAQFLKYDDKVLLDAAALYLGLLKSRQEGLEVVVSVRKTMANLLIFMKTRLNRIGYIKSVVSQMIEELMEGKKEFVVKDVPSYFSQGYIDMVIADVSGYDSDFAVFIVDFTKQCYTRDGFVVLRIFLKELRQ